MKKSFLHYDKPWITGFIMAETLEEAIAMVKKVLADGGDSVCIEITRMRPEFWNEKDLTALFAEAKDMPIYSCCYRTGFGEGHTDDELAELSMLCLKCGATLIDVMGDMYHPEPWELTFDKEAVEKQKKLIKRIHEAGGEVLMSSHNHAHYAPEQIVTWMKAQVERGADVSKDINVADTEEELIEALETYKLINQEIHVPYLFMVGGEKCSLTRECGGRLGAFMYLGRVFPEGVQPKLATLKYLRDEMKFI